MKDFIKEVVEDSLNNGEDPENRLNEIYQGGCNFNNADPTSDQTVYTESEIVQLIDEIKINLCKESDRCSSCGKPIASDDWITEENKVPYGDSGATETVCTGYKCSNCGNME